MARSRLFAFFAIVLLMMLAVNSMTAPSPPLDTTREYDRVYKARQRSIERDQLHQALCRSDPANLRC